MDTSPAPNSRSSLEIVTELLFLAVVLSGAALTAYGFHQTAKWDVLALATNFYVQIGFIFSASAVVAFVFFLKSENRKNFLITALLLSAMFHLLLLVWSGTYNVGMSPTQVADAEPQKRRAELAPPKFAREYLWVPETGEVQKSVYDEDLQEREIAPELEEMPVEMEVEPEFQPEETVEKRETEAQRMAREVRFQEQERQEELREMREMEERQERNLLKNTTQLPAVKPRLSDPDKLRPSPETAEALSRQLETSRVNLQEARLEEKKLEKKGIQDMPENFHSTVSRSEQALNAQQRSLVVADDARLRQKSQVERELSAASVIASRQPRPLPGVGETEDAAGMAASTLTQQSPRASVPVGVAATRSRTPVIGGGSDGLRTERRKVDREDGEIQVNAHRRTGAPSHAMIELAEVPRNIHGAADNVAANTAVVFRENAAQGGNMIGPEPSVDMTFSQAPAPLDGGGMADDVGLPELTPVKPTDALLGRRFPTARFTPKPYEPYRQRTRAGHRQKIIDAGGDPASEETVEYGLAFLAKTQFPDGRWAFDRLPSQLLRDKTDAERAALMAELGKTNADTGATGMALLAFLGAGYTHAPSSGDYHETVRKGLEWLVNNQQKDGSLFREISDDDRNSRTYSHGIATIALCEAYGMTGDQNLKAPAQSAIDYIIFIQSKQGGWRYAPPAGTPCRESDTSVSGWMLMALVSGKMSGLQVPDTTVRRVNQWLTQAASRDGTKFLYLHMSPEDKRKFTDKEVLKIRAAETRLAELRAAEETNPQEIEQWQKVKVNAENAIKDYDRYIQYSPTMTAEGMLMRLYLRPFEPLAYNEAIHGQGLAFLAQHPPKIDSATHRNSYYWYYGTQVMFHAGGKYWETWQREMLASLMQSQAHDGVLEGSWSYTRPVVDQWAGSGGRHYVTAIHLLMLEVYYRHLPLYKELGK